MKIAVLLYPECSLHEITTLTSNLCLHYGQTIDYIASRKEGYRSEEGLTLFPDFTFEEVTLSTYEAIILTGTVNPLPTLYNAELLAQLQTIDLSRTVVAAISSAPLFLAKAGLLKGHFYTSGLFMEIIDYFPFIDREFSTFQPVTEDGNLITAIDFAYREFAQHVLVKLGLKETVQAYDTTNYPQEEAMFYMGEEEFQGFLREIKKYE